MALRLSHERCVHLSHVFVNILEDDDSVDFLGDPNDIRLEFSCQPSNGEDEPSIVPQVTQTREEALHELETLTGDKAWLDWATTGLRG